MIRLPSSQMITTNVNINVIIWMDEKKYLVLLSGFILTIMCVIIWGIMFSPIMMKYILPENVKDL
jgi:hypothetical protein